MSISGIIHSGQSALLTAQAQIAVASTNIANASTEGYTAKTVDTAAAAVGGRATGVTVIGVGNDIDRALMAEVLGAASTAAYDATLAAYLEATLSALGTTEQGSDLESAMTGLMLALSDAVNAGGGATAQTAVEDALAAWSATLQGASASTQSARTTADEGIAEAVERVNALLLQLDALNHQIARANAAGGSTADLLDAQRVALEELSGYLDVGSYRTGTGELRLYSGGGQALLTSSARTLSYTPFGPMTAEAVYDPAGGGTVGGITIGGEDVTATLTGGEIGALIELRDRELPAIQAELDALAVGVRDAVNAAANKASPIPAPSSLTSDVAVDPLAAFGAGGTLTLLETDAEGRVVGATDIDLSTLASYRDLIDALDAAPGVTAALDGEGHLRLSADSAGHGIALAGDTSVSADDRSLSHHLGFNAILGGSGASDMAVARGVAAQGLPVAVPGTTAVGAVALAEGDSSGLQAIWSALDGPLSFAAAGTLPASEASAVSQIARVVDNAADRTEAAGERAAHAAATRDALATAFDNAHGVNVDEEMARLVAFEQAYRVSSQILATAQDMFDSLMQMMR